MAARETTTPARTWGSRLGEGAMMAVSLLLLRLLFAWLGLWRHETFLDALVQSILFGLCWVAISWVWDLLRARSSR